MYVFTYAIRTLKDTRRRISQTVLSKVGSADETKDVQYDAHVEHFQSMISDMTQCKTTVFPTLYIISACLYCHILFMCIQPIIIVQVKK